MNDSSHAEYFSSIRYDIERLLPKTVENVLEIGSGSGATLGWIKSKWPSCRTIGIDGHEGVRAELSEVADQVIIQDLDNPLENLGTFDLILALDVLEHLKNPDIVLLSLVKMLSPTGTIIVSVPNVARISVAMRLMFGKFEYADSGIMDKTHLRFFTAESAVKLMNLAGIEVLQGAGSGLELGKWNFADHLTFGMARPRLAMQLIMKGKIGQQKSKIRWEKAYRWERAKIERQTRPD